MAGAVWTTGGLGGGYVLRLVSNLILTRLLFPEIFGTMAVVNIFLFLLQSFADVGIAPNLIQHKRGTEPAFINTAWTIQVIRGGVLWVAACLLSLPAAWFYDKPDLLMYLPVASFSAVIGGFTSTSLILMNRRMEFGRLTLIHLAARIAATAATVGFALLIKSVWPLIFGVLASSLVTLIMSHQVRVGPRNRFCWERAASRELFGFGKWIFLTTLCGSLSTRADRLILARLVAFDVLGVYAIARIIPDVVESLFIQVQRRVMLPVLAIQNELPRDELRVRIGRSRMVMLLSGAVLLGLLCPVIDRVIQVLYDERYHAGGWMAILIMLGVWPVLLGASAGPALIVVGKPQYRAYGAVVRLVLLSAGMLIGYAYYGLHGLLGVIAVRGIPNYVTLLYGLRRERLLSLIPDLVSSAVFGLLLAVVWLLRSVLSATST